MRYHRDLVQPEKRLVPLDSYAPSCLSAFFTISLSRLRRSQSTPPLPALDALTP